MIDKKVGMAYKGSMNTEKEFLSLEETAELLGVDYQLVYKLVRSGALPAVSGEMKLV